MKHFCVPKQSQNFHKYFQEVSVEYDHTGHHRRLEERGEPS